MTLSQEEKILNGSQQYNYVMSKKNMWLPVGLAAADML